MVKEWFESLVEEYGVSAVTVLMFVENVFPPIPSEVVMPLAGYAASQGKASFTGVVLAGALGSLLGALPLYYLGRCFSFDSLISWSESKGRYIGLGPKELRQAKEWFDKHGGKAVFACRLVPGLRSLISIPAGSARMPLARFTLLTAAGSVLWCLLLAWLGRSFGESHGAVSKYVGYASWVVLGAIAILAFRLWWKRRGRRSLGCFF